MRDSGQWWLPTVRGNPYLNKPPFKMWLTFVPLALFGESTFSYRFLDALAGTLTCIALYFFSRRIFRSRLAGIAAALALIGCNAYVFGHGVRKAVQDSMLIFLSTLALMLGWIAIESLLESRSRLRAGLAAGICVGLASLTKSVAGTLPLIIAAAFFLLDSASRKKIVKAPGLLLAVALPALFIPAMYMLPHCLFTPGACSTIFGSEVATRIEEGYHNKDQFWFYFIRLFPDRQAIGPELMVPSILWAAAVAFFRRSSLHKFLLLWALLPIALFTLIPSRLTWYISLAFPGLAIIVGGACAAAWNALREPVTEWWYRGISLPVSRLVDAAFLLLAVGSIGWNLNAVAAQIGNLPVRSNFDLLTSQILDYGKKHPGSGHVASFDAPVFALHESTYGGMLQPITTIVDSPSELLKLADDKRYSFFFTGLQDFKNIFTLRPVAAYRYFAPFYDRKQWLVVFTYDESIHLPQLTPAAKVIRFSDPNLDANYGTADQSTINGLEFRRLQGDELSIPIEGDPALKSFGSTIKLNFSVTTDDPLTVTLKLNTDEVASKSIGRSNFRTWTVSVPPDVWMDGTNTIFLTLKRVDGRPIEARSRPALLNWLSVHPGVQTEEAQTDSGNNPAIEK